MSQPIHTVHKDYTKHIDEWSPQIPSEWLENSDIVNPLTQLEVHENKVYFLSRIETPDEGGIYVYHVGVPYPKKGFPYPRMMHSLNTTKKILLGYLSFLGAPEFRLPLLSLVFVSWKKKIALAENFLGTFARLGYWQMEPHFLKERYYMDCVKELRKWIEAFLVNIGISQGTSFRFAKVFGTFIEGDDAYRLHFEDIMSEAIKANFLSNPRKEIRRLGKIYASREHPLSDPVEHASAIKKITFIFTLVSFLMFLPRIRRAFIKATKDINLGKMGLDAADKYHTLLVNDYNYQGKSFVERCWEYRTLHPEEPPFVLIGGSPVQDINDTPLPSQIG